MLTKAAKADTFKDPSRKKDQMPAGSAAFVIHTDPATGRQTADAKEILGTEVSREDRRKLNLYLLNPEIGRSVLADPDKEEGDNRGQR
jgi:hypothetical protein